MFSTVADPPLRRSLLVLGALVVAACGDASKPSGPVATITAVPAPSATSTASAAPSGAPPTPLASGSAASAPSLGAGAYKNPKAGFAADLACNPSVTDDDKEHAVVCPAAPWRTVRWHDEADGKADTKKVFDTARDAAVKALDPAKVVSERDLDVGGHAARDVTLEVEKDGKPTTRLLRLLLVERRVYEISTGDDDASERERFVSTFTILK